MKERYSHSFSKTKQLRPNKSEDTKMRKHTASIKVDFLDVYILANSLLSAIRCLLKVT